VRTESEGYFPTFLCLLKPKQLNNFDSCSVASQLLFDFGVFLKL